MFFDLVLVFALIGVVSRVVPDLLSDDVRPRWLSLLYTVGTCPSGTSNCC
ncbi:hypothetical protein [Micromonospora sp. MA102]|nr:hypothetical protein [Micromonospora sp. MA102]